MRLRVDSPKSASGIFFCRLRLSNPRGGSVPFRIIKTSRKTLSIIKLQIQLCSGRKLAIPPFRSGFQIYAITSSLFFPGNQIKFFYHLFLKIFFKIILYSFTGNPLRQPPPIRRRKRSKVFFSRAPPPASPPPGQKMKENPVPTGFFLDFSTFSA